MTLRGILGAFSHPSKILPAVVLRTPNIWSDKLYLQCLFQRIGGGKLNINQPVTYNEKLNWMKLNYRNPLYTQLVDKIEVKNYVDKILGPGYNVETIATYDSVEDIDFDKLPNEFVLKCNHTSKIGLIICRDKKNGIIFKGREKDETPLTYEEVKEELRKGLKHDYYKVAREWPYKNVKRRILAEKFMKTEDGSPLKDYKIFCFDGEPKYIWCGTNYEPTYFDFYDLEWNRIPVEYGHPNLPEPLEKPAKLDEMLGIAAKLSKDMPHVRIDLYLIGDKLYLGEFTFFTHAGLLPFNPPEFDRTLGDLFKLPAPMK